jgi:hypothetical protein
LAIIIIIIKVENCWIVKVATQLPIKGARIHCV